MSNPFLDSPLFGEEGDRPADPPQHNGNGGNSVGGVNKSNPFSQDLLGEEYPGQPGVQSSNPYSDTLLDFTSGVTDLRHHAHNDGLVAEDVLLDLGDCGGGSMERQASSSQPNSGLMDLLGSSDSQFRDSFMDIPPPMQFSDPSTTATSSRTNTYVTPVTNIDDLLGLDFLSDIDPMCHNGADSELSKDNSDPYERSYGDGFDYLPDLQVARDPMVSDGSIEEEGVPPRLPSEPPPPVPTEPPPSPSVAVDPPPDIATHPDSALPTEPTSGVSEESSDNVATYSSSAVSVDVPSDVLMMNPPIDPPNSVQTYCRSTDLAASPSALSADLSSALSKDLSADVIIDSSAVIPEDCSPSVPSSAPPALPVNPPPPVPAGLFLSEPSGDVNNVTTEADHEEDASGSNTTSLFLPSPNPSDNVTQISVTSASADASHNNNTIHVTDITVTSPASNTSAVTVTTPKPAPLGADVSMTFPGAAVVMVDNSSTPNATHIQFDNSTQETVVKSTLPPNAFRPTSVGITKTVKSSSHASGQEEEEEITPMMVHRDHQGNKMAAPSPPETLGRQFNGPRKLDQDAKRDLQTVLSRMNNVPKLSAMKSVLKEDGPSVSEDEIVPVKLTRQEAELAKDVLSKWMNKESEASVLSPPSPTRTSGFQKVVGTVINIQSGKEPLPNNSVFLTTMGVTKAPSSGEKEGVEEDIVPMSLHKDHLGNKHYAPSPPESLGRQSGVRQLDSAAKQDIANLLSGMASTRKIANSVVKQAGDDDVREEEIVATVLSREQSRLAKEAVTRWLDGEKDRPLHKLSPFQRLVENVMDSTAETERKDFIDSTGKTEHQDVTDSTGRTEQKDVVDSTGKTEHQDVSDSTDQTDHADTQVEPQGQSLTSNESRTAENFEQVLSQPLELSATVSAPVSTPPMQVTQQTSSPLADSKPPSTQTESQPAKEEKKTLFEEPIRTENQNDSEPGSTRIMIKNGSPTTITPVEKKPKSSQRDSTTTATTTSIEAKPSSSAKVTATAITSTEAKPSSSSRVTVTTVTTEETKLNSSKKGTATATTSAETKVSSSKRVTATTNTSVETKPKSSPRTTSTVDETRQAQPSQRGLRAPSKITSLPQTASKSSKPLSKLGTLSIANRAPVPPLASSRLTARMEYGKTRNDQSPFLVEVLKGIVGLGIKVKVNREGHVEITEVQRNSPMDKNGNVKVGDYVLFINTTELKGLTDGRVQQLLRLLPRGLAKLVVSTQPPPQGHESSEQTSTKSGGAYSQFGVRLSPRPFSPSSSDGQTSSLTSPLAQDTVTSPVLPSTPFNSSEVPSLASAVTQGPVSSPSQTVEAPVFTFQTRVPEREKDSSTQRVLTLTSSETSVTTSSILPPEKETVSPTAPSPEVEADLSPSPEVPGVASLARPTERETPGSSVRRSDFSSTEGQAASLSSSGRQSQVQPEGESIRPTHLLTHETEDGSVAEDQEDTEDDDMEARKLSKALSPRHPADQSHTPEVAIPSRPTPSPALRLAPKPEAATPPKPVPRHRASLPPASLSVSQNESNAEEGQDHGQGSPRPEHKLTPSEIVAAASRRPSARDDDLLLSLSLSSRDGLHTEKARSSRDISRDADSTKTVKGVGSPREETSTSKASVARPSPVPTPRHRSRTMEEKYTRPDGDQSPRGEVQSVKNEPEIRRRAESAADSTSVVHASVVTIVPESAPFHSDAAKSDVPSPVSRRPRNLSRVEDTPRDLPSPSPSPTLVSSRLRAFADPDAPTLEDQAQNRKFVSSAARMFEQKASDKNSSLPFAKYNKSSVSVSSLVKSLNSQEPDTYSRSGVTMRKKSVGVTGRADRPSSYSSSLTPVSERRKSMPSPITGSSSPQLSHRSNLSHLKNLSSSTVTLNSEQADHDHPSRFNSALMPRQSRATTTSLKSVMAAREYEEDRRAQSPPSVGKNRDSKRTSMLSDVTLRSRSSVHDPHSPTSQSNRKSWSPHTNDFQSIRSQFTSSSLHRNDRLGASMTSLNSPHLTDRQGSSMSSLTSARRHDRLGSSMTSLNTPHPTDRLGSSMTSLTSPHPTDRLGSSRTSRASSCWGSAPSGNMDSAIKKFDDLASDRHTLEFDDELPRVSNSVCLDFKSRAAERAKVDETTVEQSTDRAKDSTTQSSAEKAEVPKKSWRQATPEPVSLPRSSSPVSSCERSPDMILVEERKTLRKREVQTKQNDDLVQPRITHALDTTKKGMKSEQTHAGDAAFGYIMAQGLQGQTPSETGQGEDKDQLRMKTSLLDIQQTTGEVKPQVPCEFVSVDSVPKDKTQHSTDSQIVETDSATQDQKQRNVSVSQIKVVETEDYPEKDNTTSLGKIAMKDSHQGGSAKSSGMPDNTNYSNLVTSIVQTVISESLEGEKQVPAEDNDKGSDDDDSPPPLPDEGPPPLPGAPPPPLAVRREVDMLVDVEDLEGMVPTQETPPPPSSQQGLARPEAQHSEDLPTIKNIASEDAEVDTTVKAGVSAASFSLPLQQCAPGLTQAVQNNEQKSVGDSDLLVPSPSTPPPQHLPPPTKTNLLVEVDFPGKEEADNGQENPPVSDTLSQDSGVQDEDMSEDGLRFSMDDSPTTTSLFDTAITPDDLPASVMNESEEGPQDSQDDPQGGQEVQSVVKDHARNVPVPHKPVPTPRRNVHTSASHVSPRTPLTAKDNSVVAASQSMTVVSVSPSAAVNVDKVNDSVSQGSVSPRCSSDLKVTEVVPAPGGVSTTGDTDGNVVRRRHKDFVATESSSAGHDIAVKASVVTETRTHGTDFSEESKVHAQPVHTEQKVDTKLDKLTTDTHHELKDANTNKPGKLATNTHSPPEPQSTASPITENKFTTDTYEQKDTSKPGKLKTDIHHTKLEKLTTHTHHPPNTHHPPGPQSPTSPTTEDDDDEDEEEDDDQEESPYPEESTPNSAKIASSRKWCILDQSGSLFLQGASNGSVDVGKAMLRQVASLHPGQLEEMLGTANKDLDEAKVPLTVELRVVAARGLDGAPVRFDLVQREDYFVQVTRVHSKDSSVQEADLLLFIDGHTQRHRRPRMVQSQLNSTGPKAVLLTARGVKLPPSVAVVAAAGEAVREDRPRSVSAPPPATTRTPATTSITSVQTEPGVYEITMSAGSTGVGFCLEGGKGSSQGDMPILIKRIFKAGPADKGGVLKVGDEVLSVNGVDFTTLGHFTAWNHLKAIKDAQITLRIRRAE